LFGIFAIGFSLTPALVKFDYPGILGAISLGAGVFIGAAEAQAKLITEECADAIPMQCQT
jgi:hypothetical protein